MTEGSDVEVSKIVDEVKSRGLFDQLRRDCLRDMETESAFRRLKDEVDKYCARFLTGQTWHPGLNKTELRDRLRERLMRADFVNNGVKSLVHRLVGQEKMEKALYRPVERIVYSYLGLPYELDGHSSAEELNAKSDETRGEHSGGDSVGRIGRARGSDSMDEPLSKRACVPDRDATTSASGHVVNDDGEETPVHHELSHPPVDPAPSGCPQLDSSGELSVSWHVTQLSPNPDNERTGTAGVERAASSSTTRVENDGEVESPWHEGL